MKNKNTKDSYVRAYYDFDSNYGCVIVEDEKTREFILKALPLWDFQDATDRYQKKKYAQGGIVNQYEGKGLGEVWDEWTPEQVEHFLRDHDSILHLDPPQAREIITMSWIELLKSDRVSTFKKSEIYKSLNSHINEGQYASGGSIGHIPNSYEGQTGHEIWDAWTLSQRKHFLLDHMEEIGTNLFEINHKLPKMQYVDLPPIVASVLYKHISEGQYAKGGKIEKTVKTSKVGDRQHTIDAKVSRNLKIYIYKYNGKEGYVVSAKFTGYPEVFVERVFTTYSEAVKDAEERAGMFRFGGNVAKKETYSLELYISGSMRGIAHPESGKNKEESFNIAILEAKKFFASGKYSAIWVVDDSDSHVEYLFDDYLAPVGRNFGKNEFQVHDNSEFDKVMKEFNDGKLKNKEGEIVINTAEAVLIGYEQERIAWENEKKSPKMAKGGSTSENSFKKVMDEFKRGTLTDGHGKKVTSRGQALAIAYAETEHKRKFESGGDIDSFEAGTKFLKDGDEKAEIISLDENFVRWRLLSEPRFINSDSVNRFERLVKNGTYSLVKQSNGGHLFQFDNGEKVKVTLTEDTDGKTGEVDGVIVSRGSGSSQLVEYVLDGKKVQKYKDAGETVHKMSAGGNIEEESESKAAAIKTAVQIGAIAAEHNIKAAELSLEEFSKKIFDASKIAFAKADLMFSHKVLSKIKYASGGETDSATEVKVGGYPYYLR